MPRVALCGLNLAPGMAPWAVRGVRFILLSWSLVTESNRRPSPYHGSTSGLIALGMSSDQVIRWYPLAQASLKQRVWGKRHEGYCLSK